MSDTDTSTEPKEEVAPAPGAQDLRDMLRTHGLPVAIGMGVAAVILIGFTWYRSQARSAETRASDMLSAAASTRQLQEIQSQYPSTTSAKIAALMLARTSYDSGEFNTATTAYDDFIKKYPEDAMVPAAKLGKVHCLEAQGLAEQALAGFQEFKKAFPDHYLTPVAIFGEARALDQLGRTAEAKAIYEDFIAAHPQTPRAAEAEAALAVLNRKANSGATPR